LRLFPINILWIRALVFHLFSTTQVFASRNILSAPIFDSSQSRCLGFLDLGDILEAVLGWFKLSSLPDVDRLEALKKAGRDPV
jgi:hypothetical protein